MELLILPTFFTFLTFNRNKVTYKNNPIPRNREKMIFFFFQKNCTCTLFLGNYSLHKSLISWSLTFHMQPKSWYHENWRFKMRIVYSISIRTIPLDNESAKLARRRGEARGISARKSAIYVFTRKEAQMKLDAARRIKRRRGYHGIGSLCHLELTPRYAAKWLLPRRRCLSRDAQDWSIRLMRFDNNNDNDGDDEVNNNKERLHHARDA